MLRLPVHAWLLLLAVVVGGVLLATPLRDWAYPIAVASFYAQFGAFVGGAPKGGLRWSSVVLGMNLFTIAVMCVAIAMSSWGNVLLTLGGVTLFFGLHARYLFFSALGYTRFWQLDLGFMIGGIVLSVVGSLQSTSGIAWFAMSPHALFSVVGVVMVTGRQLRMLRAGRDAVAIGDEAPDFTLESHRGEKVTLSDFRNERLVLLFFVRGDWCPGCHIMLRAYERNREKFAAKNTAVLAIGPDPKGVNREMVETLRLEYGLLHDEGLEVAKAYRVLLHGKQAGTPYEEGLPVPTSFLIDKDGIVRFASKPDRAGMLLDPEAIFPVLEAL